MAEDVKHLCEKIEALMKLYRDNDHELLYEKTMHELTKVNFSSIFMNINNLPLYRVRLNEESNILFDKIKDIYHAPIKYVSSYGRVNKPGQSMFYCSEISSNCDLELLHDYLLKNDIGHERLATYFEWSIQKDLNLLVLAIAPSHREISNGFTLRNDCFKFVKSEPTAEQETYSNFYKVTSNFFLKNAKKDYSVYVVCSAIANYFTLQFPNINGLIYPTVQGNTGYNIVLRPHTIDNKLIIPKSEVIMKRWLVTTKNQMTIDPSFHKTGHISGDDILWDKK